MRRVIWKIIDRLLLKLFVRRMDAEGKWLERHEERIVKKYNDLIKELALEPVNAKNERRLDALKDGLERDCRAVIEQAQFIPPKGRETALGVLMTAVARRGTEEMAKYHQALSEEKRSFSAEKRTFH